MINMNTTLGFKECPCCGKKVALSFDHTMPDKYIDQIEELWYLKE